MKEIFSFSSSEFTKDENLIQLFGMRGRNLMDLAALGIPILPGFILTEAFLAEDEEDPQTHEPIYLDAFDKMGGIEISTSEQGPLVVSFPLLSDGATLEDVVLNLGGDQESSQVLEVGTPIGQ